MIRPVRIGDAQALADIYNYYILNTVITFEETPLDAAEMESRIRKITADYPWFVTGEDAPAGAPPDGALSGNACASRWGERASYRYTAAATVYLTPGAQGRGIGTALYRALLDDLAARGVHTVIGGIALPNEKSQRLHEKFGFKKAAHLAEVGYKFNRWIDVGYWQLVL